MGILHGTMGILHGTMGILLAFFVSSYPQVIHISTLETHS